LALFLWAISARTAGDATPFSFVLADYNPTVLQLVTLPNFILSWALHEANESAVLTEALTADGELELDSGVLRAFEDFLSSRNISLHFFSGAWSAEFVELIKAAQGSLAAGAAKQRTVILGAETIYSPFALQSFTETIFSLMEQQKSRGHSTEVFVAAKRLYFGVGGSLDDFVTKAKDLGAVVEQLREETEGVRRGVVKCYLRP
jgi:protein-histidine N-methyltransferase